MIPEPPDHAPTTRQALQGWVQRSGNDGEISALPTATGSDRRHRLVITPFGARLFYRLPSHSVWDESLLDRLPRLIFEMLLGYILRADIDKTDFDNKIKLFQKAETRTTAMSLAEQLRQEGHLAGRQEGHLAGRQEAVLAYLEIRFGPVPQGLVEAMRQVADPARLESLQRTSFTCASIEEFAAAL